MVQTLICTTNLTAHSLQAVDERIEKQPKETQKAMNEMIHF